jgi:hypothetical protein
MKRAAAADFSNTHSTPIRLFVARRQSPGAQIAVRGSPINHGEVSASLLRPYISPENWWILAHHEIFQLYYYGDASGAKDKNLRDELKDSPYWEACEKLCLHYDQNSFDGAFKNWELAFFEPMVHWLLQQPATPRSSSTS